MQLSEGTLQSVMEHSSHNTNSDCLGVMVRPCIYTDDIHYQLMVAARNLCSNNACAGYAGIGASTLSRWLTLGKDGQEPYATLLTDMGIERNAGRAELTMKTYGSALENPKIGLKMMERAEPEAWGDKTVPHIGININLSHADPLQMAGVIFNALPTILRLKGVPAHQIPIIEAEFRERAGMEEGSAVLDVLDQVTAATRGQHAELE